MAIHYRLRMIHTDLTLNLFLKKLPLGDLSGDVRPLAVISCEDAGEDAAPPCADFSSVFPSPASFLVASFWEAAVDAAAAAVAAETAGVPEAAGAATLSLAPTLPSFGTDFGERAGSVFSEG